jgi:hypothetical protein
MQPSAFVADERDGHQVVDLSAPSAPMPLSGFKTAEPAPRRR